MPTDAPAIRAIPLASWTDRQLKALAQETGSQALAALNGATLMGERAALGNFRISGKVSAGPGTSRLLPTRDGRWFALTIPRPEDREMLPALFQVDELNIQDWDAIAAAVAEWDCADLLTRGRELGLPVAASDENPVSDPVTILTRGPHRERDASALPLVIDLSAIWAGPLAGNLLWLAGAHVVKVESRKRPDAMRHYDPGIFDLVNQGKDNIAVDFSSEREKAALVSLLRRADIVIESSRPRALRQLGIDADALVKETPGLVWLTITGHGATGEAANWAGIGHDCGVAAGLSRALAEASGQIGYVGDAIADPLTGVTAALEGWRAFRRGHACRIGFALSALAALALKEERERDAAAIEAELRAWGAATGQPFPSVEERGISAEVHAFGADTASWLEMSASC